jgi:NitT/TauT family transport system substrate-binding protein
MKIQQLTWAKASLAAVVAFGLAGCGGNNTSGGTTATSDAGNTSTPETTTADNGPSEIKKVTIGYLPNIVMPQPLLGLANGEYAKRVPGVEFAGKDFPAGPAVMEALRGGVVDIAYTGPYPPIKAYGKDRDMVLLAGSATGGTEIMVNKNSAIKTVQDLKGKAVAINQNGSTVDAMVRYNLLEAGLNPEKDVKLIVIPPAQQADALKRNEVAAVAAPAPWPSFVAINGNGRALLDWKQILADGDYLAGVVFTTKKFADKNPNFVKQFVAAHRAITDELNADRTKGDAAVLAAWSEVTTKRLAPDVAKAAFKTIQFTNEADLEGLKRDADIAVKVGILRKKADLTGFVYQD